MPRRLSAAKWNARSASASRCSPIRVEDVLPSQSLEFFISSAHWIDAWRGNLSDHGKRLAQDMSNESTVASVVQSTQSRPRRPQQPHYSPALIFAAVAIGGAILLAGYLIKNALTRLAAPTAMDPTSAAYASMANYKVPTPETPEQIQARILSDEKTRVFQQNEQVLSNGGGLKLAVTTTPSGQKPFDLFAVFPSPEGTIEYVPMVPPDTTSVRYEFDDGGYFDVTPNPNTYRAHPPFPFEDADGGTKISLMVKDASGNETGPYVFISPSKKSLIEAQLKAKFLANLATAIKCGFIPIDLNSVATDDIKKFSITNALSTAGFAPVDKSPVVVCAPVYHTSDFANLPWVAVKEVHLGAQSGQLTEVVPTKVDWDQIFKPGAAVGALPFDTAYSGAKIWSAEMPPDTKSVYAKFIFQDGTESPEEHYPIQTLNLTN